jgi:hypothetical protein
MEKTRPNRTKAVGAGGPRFVLTPAVFVTLLAALAAGTAGVFLTGTVAYGAIALVAIFAAILTALVTRRADDGRRIQGLLKLAEEGGARERRVPAEYAGEWGTLYVRTNELAEEARTARAALKELEGYRRHGEIALSALRGGKDPLAEIPELRVGPLRDVLEAARSSAVPDPVVNRISLGDEDLIGVVDAGLPETWPKGAPMSATPDPAINAEVRKDVDEIVRGLGELHASLSGNGAKVPAEANGAARTPAQLLDAVVHTAADGIEDLAAGLMRANELASVAERVTNRATLLALNAALEATRSGSEAFAAIAEETRRLAEFAREATDTVSRLASEIEYKVGETITAIHSTSEDAKFSLAQFSGAAAGAAPSTSLALAQVDSLLRRAGALRRALDSPPHSLVENGTSGAEESTTETIQLLEGLHPGARLDS